MATEASTSAQDGWGAPEANGATDRKASIVQQRRSLPDQPGVYMFRDGRGRVIYVG